MIRRRSKTLGTLFAFGHNGVEENPKMFTDGIGRGGQRIIDAMVRWLASGHINPNILTVIGVSLNVGCGLLFGMGWFFSAGIALIVANLFDMLDGQVARLSGRVTRFGGFLDSSLDRLSDMVIFVGLMIFYARITPQHSTLNVFLAGAGLMGSVMVSYASARREPDSRDVGFKAPRASGSVYWRVHAPEIE
jgi:CDP-diacylglycerol--glycerol-3-phosphate 3-phosphatidyltransferase